MAQSPSLSLRNAEEVPPSQSYPRLQLEGCVGVLQAEKGVGGVELYHCKGFGKLGFESGELRIPLKVSLSCGSTDLKVLYDLHHVVSVGTTGRVQMHSPATGTEILTVATCLICHPGPLRSNSTPASEGILISRLK